MAAVSERIEYMEKVRREVLKLLTECKTADMLKQNLSQQDQMIDKLLNTQKTTKQLIKELMITEEKVAQRLSDREEELKASIQKLQKIEQKWLQTNKKDEKLRININELRKELETLREESKQQQQNATEEADRSMSATYLVHLYYQICQIDWDYSCEPPLIKGTHYGPDIAQSINLDSSQHSPCFISDYLWNLVNTSW